MVDVAVIGGGPAGMMAAIQAAEKKQVILLERLERTGKKLLATGNGRCNFSNLQINCDHYYGNKKFIENILKQFGTKEAVGFFKSIGLPAREIEGRLYPNSLQAVGVLDMLRSTMQAKGVQEQCNFEVTKIKRLPQSFLITGEKNKEIEAKSVIMATGGLAGQNLGANGSGYVLLQDLGHSLYKPFPALAPLICKSNYGKSLHGIRIPASITAFNGIHSKQETGEVQFTDYGISGICVMQVSRLFEGGNKKGTVTIDALPEFEISEIISYILNKTMIIDALENLLNGLIHKKIGLMVLKELGYSLLQKSSTLSAADAEKIAEKLKNMVFHVEAVKPFVNAQVTAGGIHVEEIDMDTMESKKIPDLYVIGELLNVDGDCGGYNLHWCWATGFIAGKTAGKGV